MSLEEKLRDRSERFSAETPSEIVTAMLRADVWLMRSGVSERALKAGDSAPDFSLTDLLGNTVSLSALLGCGPVVISFYRGNWCPYCSLEIQALTELYPEIIKLGASLIAISPQKPDRMQASDAPFPLVSDPGSKVAEGYGLAFRLPDELRPVYERLGHPLSKVNAASDWVLPIPATYIIDEDGRIVLSFVDVDYRRRLEPREIINVISGLRRRDSSWRS